MRILLVTLALISFTVHAQDHPIEEDRAPKITLIWGVNFDDGRVLPKVCWAKDKCSVMSPKMHDIWVAWTVMTMQTPLLNPRMGK